MAIVSNIRRVYGIVAEIPWNQAFVPDSRGQRLKFKHTLECKERSLEVYLVAFIGIVLEGHNQVGNVMG